MAAKKPIPPKDELQELYNTPMTKVEIASHYGVSLSVVKRWMYHHEIKTRIGRSSHKVDSNDVSIDDLRRMYESGLTDAQIGEKVGMTGKAVWARRATAGIQSRGRGTYRRGKANHTDAQPKARPFLRLTEHQQKSVLCNIKKFLMHKEIANDLE